MKRKRFFSSAEKLERRTKRLDAIAKAKGEKTDLEIKATLGGSFSKEYSHKQPDREEWFATDSKGTITKRGTKK